MTQIVLREHRAKQARPLGEQGPDVAAAALRIQKVREAGGAGRGAAGGVPAAAAVRSGARSAGRNPAFSPAGFNSRKINYLTRAKPLTKLDHGFCFVLFCF